MPAETWFQGPRDELFSPVISPSCVVAENLRLCALLRDGHHDGHTYQSTSYIYIYIYIDWIGLCCVLVNEPEYADHGVLFLPSLVLIWHPVRHYGRALPCWFAVGVRAAMCGFTAGRWLIPGITKGSCNKKTWQTPSKAGHCQRQGSLPDRENLEAGFRKLPETVIFQISLAQSTCQAERYHEPGNLTVFKS
ncbi:hypothetical protein J6590_075360 [Homalodisca vitripennis]|nr:hypothetical protein J6590_075360 [Homalodisca vitripennis]